MPTMALPAAAMRQEGEAIPGNELKKARCAGLDTVTASDEEDVEGDDGIGDGVGAVVGASTEQG